MTAIPTFQAVELPGGLIVPYLEQGDRDGVPLILLHGITDSHRSFEPVLAALPDDIHAFAITARGHGDAGKPETGYSAAQMADDVIDFMDAAGIERAIVAGHSMGSWSTQRIAAGHPDRVIGAVLAGAFATFHGRSDIEALRQEFRTLSDPVDPAHARAWQESTLARPVPESFLAMVVEETCKAPVRVWDAGFAGLLADVAEPPGRITAPTLLVWGEHDDFVPRSDQGELLSRIPRSQLKIYAGGGHAMHWEEPERFAADVAEFAAAIT